MTPEQRKEAMGEFRRLQEAERSNALQPADSRFRRLRLK
jgi:hypothetical protein